MQIDIIQQEQRAEIAALGVATVNLSDALHSTLGVRRIAANFVQYQKAKGDVITTAMRDAPVIAADFLNWWADKDPGFADESTESDVLFDLTAYIQQKTWDLKVVHGCFACHEVRGIVTLVSLERKMRSRMAETVNHCINRLPPQSASEETARLIIESVNATCLEFFQNNTLPVLMEVRRLSDEVRAIRQIAHKPVPEEVN